MGLLSVIILTDCSDWGAYLSKGTVRGQQRWGLGTHWEEESSNMQSVQEVAWNETTKTKAGDTLSGTADIRVTFGVLVAFRVTYEQVRPWRVTPTMRWDKYSSCQTEVFVLNSCTYSTYATKWSSLSIGLVYIYIFFPWSPASTLIYSNENCKTP